jgi:polar amino acid transport system substrate-binding protein
MAALVLAVVLTLGCSAPSVAQQPDSTWDQIKQSGKLRVGVLDYPPYWYREKGTGKWVGAMVEMAEDIAKTMNVELVNVDVGGWGNTVLNLASNKTDMQIGLVATPQRAMAIDFAGPIYWLGWTTVNSKSFNAVSWADYNKPTVRIASIAGSSDETVARKVAPLAQHTRLKDLSDIILAVTSGRADALVTTVMTTMIEKNRNPDLGTLNYPEPHVAMAGYIGLRLESDTRFQKFLQRWSEWNVTMGSNEERFRRHLAAAGVTEIPDSVSFAK